MSLSGLRTLIRFTGYGISVSQMGVNPGPMLLQVRRYSVSRHPIHLGQSRNSPVLVSPPVGSCSTPRLYPSLVTHTRAFAKRVRRNRFDHSNEAITSSNGRCDHIRPCLASCTCCRSGAKSDMPDRKFRIEPSVHTFLHGRALQVDPKGPESLLFPPFWLEDGS